MALDQQMYSHWIILNYIELGLKSHVASFVEKAFVNRYEFVATA